MPTNAEKKDKKADRQDTLTFISEHFGLVSTIVIALSYFWSAIFLYSYVAIFDWRAIWIVELSDIFKVALIAAVIFASVALPIILGLGYELLQGADRNNISPLARGVLFVVFLLAMYLMFMWTEWKSPREPMYTFYTLIFLSLLLISALMWVAFDFPHLFSIKINGGPIEVASIAVVFIGSAVLFGSTLAVVMRDTGGFLRDVTVKGEKLEMVGLVLATSHHAILAKNGRSIIVPISDVDRIEASNPTSSPRRSAVSP